MKIVMCCLKTVFFSSLFIFFFNDTATTEIYTLSLHDALPILWDSNLAVNLKGTFFCCRAAAQAMKSGDGGNIINISSIAGTTGIGSSMAYCASKAGVICMTKSLARTLAPEIQVNTIAPGFVISRWTADWPEFRETNEEATPLKRVATPEDVAEAALFLVRSDFVTGETIIVDGGKSL